MTAGVIPESITLVGSVLRGNSALCHAAMTTNIPTRTLVTT